MANLAFSMLVLDSFLHPKADFNCLAKFHDSITGITGEWDIASGKEAEEPDFT